MPLAHEQRDVELPGRERGAGEPVGAIREAAVVTVLSPGTNAGPGLRVLPGTVPVLVCRTTSAPVNRWTSLMKPVSSWTESMKRPATAPPGPPIVPVAGLSTYGPPTSLIRCVPRQARTRTMWKRLSRKRPTMAARTAAGSPAATALRKAGSSAAWCSVRATAEPRASPPMTLRATYPIAFRRVSAAVGPHSDGDSLGSASEIVACPDGNSVAANAAPERGTRARSARSLR